MHKYAPLLAYLRGQPSPELVLSFAQIEAIVGSSLPASAYSASWWASEKLGAWAVRDARESRTRPEIAASLLPGGERVRFRRLPGATPQQPILARGDTGRTRPASMPVSARQLEHPAQ